MVVVESEFSPSISKDHIYIINRVASRAAEKIAKKHRLPERIVLKITARPQPSDAYIDYSNWKIVVDYSSMNIQKELIEQKALEGLLAHELMHMAQKLDGTEEKIIRFFSAEFKSRGFGEEMFEMMETLGMVVKDIFANDALIGEGFSDALFKHYQIVIHSRPRQMALPFGELSGRQIENSFLALVGLFPAYASFYRTGKKQRAELIKSAINWHFSDFPNEMRVLLEDIESALLEVELTQKGIHNFVESVLRCYSLLSSY